MASIGHHAFQDCTSLTSIVIPNSITSIGRGAFAHCSSVDKYTIPDSVTSIGYGAFWNCKNVEIPNGINYDDREPGSYIYGK